ncbi:MAG TPA: DUF2207 domain-containing protein, partial [bacterium]|nr:DUF2207 domain-containing protein [bacterium]
MKIRYSAVLLALVLGLALSASARSEKSYRMGPVHIEARLDPAGSLVVDEQRTYHFTGTYHYAYRSLPLREGVHYSDLAVLEGGQAYSQSPGEEPGRFTVNEADGALEVRWYFSARNEERTFVFHYRIDGAVSRHADAAVFYYQFIGKDWSKKQNDVTLTLHPPVEGTTGEVLHWLHGPLWARSAIQPSGRITATCAELPARVFLELRALYPPEWFAGLPPQQDQVRPGILAEEARWAAEANRMRAEEEAKAAVRSERSLQGRYYAAVLALIGLLAWFYFYRTYGKRPLGHEFIPAQSPEIPDDTPPAIVSHLLNLRNVTSAALLATLYDLARRGFLQLSETEAAKHGLFGGTKKDYLLQLQSEALHRRRHELAGYEIDLLDFLFKDLARGGTELRMKEIGKNVHKVQSFFRGWQKSVTKRVDELGLYDKRSERGMYRAMICCGAGFVVSLLLLIWYAPWPGAAAAIYVALLIMAAAIMHRTEEGEVRYRRWKALARY